MIDPSFLNSSFFNWVILPALIFLARVCDVTIGTVRLVLVARGRKIIAPILGFFEVLIWLLAIRQIMSNLTHWITYIAFAGGYAMGNYVGMVLEEKLAVGLEVFRIITKKDSNDLMNDLKDEGYGVTCVDAQGTTGKVNLIFTIINRRDHKKVIKLIHRFDPKAFYSVEDIRSASEGIFPLRDRKFWNILKGTRQGK